MNVINKLYRESQNKERRKSIWLFSWNKHFEWEQQSCLCPYLSPIHKCWSMMMKADFRANMARTRGSCLKRLSCKSTSCLTISLLPQCRLPRGSLNGIPACFSTWSDKNPMVNRIASLQWQEEIKFLNSLGKKTNLDARKRNTPTELEFLRKYAQLATTVSVPKSWH